MSNPIVNGKIEEPFVIGGHVRRHTKIIQGCDDYTVGGDEIIARDLGDTWILSMPPVISNSGNFIAYFVRPDSAKVKTVKMLVVRSGTGTESSAEDDLSEEFFVAAIDMVG